MVWAIWASLKAGVGACRALGSKSSTRTWMAAGWENVLPDTAGNAVTLNDQTPSTTGCRPSAVVTHAAVAELVRKSQSGLLPELSLSGVTLRCSTNSSSE